MNYAGCKRKFDVEGYIAYVNRLLGGIKKRNAENMIGVEGTLKLKYDLKQDSLKER